MTERQLLSLIREGGSTKDILAKMPQVQLQLIDGTMYADSGRVETISGVIEPDYRCSKHACPLPQQTQHPA